MRRKGYCVNNDLIAPLTSVLDRRIMDRQWKEEWRLWDHKVKKHCPETHKQ